MAMPAAGMLSAAWSESYLHTSAKVLERWVCVCASSGMRLVRVRVRVSIEGVIGHEWFENIDVYKLYDSTPPEMNVGKVKKGMVDEKWKRRQHSMIWSPTNERYDFDEESTSLEKGDKGEEERFLREPYYDIDDDSSGEEKDMILCDEEKEEEEKGIEGLEFIEEDEEEKGDDF